MKHYSLVIEPKLVKEVDELIRKNGMYSSRSDFIRDAIRARLIEVKKVILGKDEGKGRGGEKGAGIKEARAQEGRKEMEKEGEIISEVMEDKSFKGVH